MLKLKNMTATIFRKGLGDKQVRFCLLNNVMESQPIMD